MEREEVVFGISAAAVDIHRAYRGGGTDLAVDDELGIVLGMFILRGTLSTWCIDDLFWMKASLSGRNRPGKDIKI